VGGRREAGTTRKGAIVAGPARDNCIYSCCDPELWLCCLWRGEPILPRCRFEGTDHWLGSFATELEAARAYDRQAVEWLGEFARLNFPEEWPPEKRMQIRAERGRARRKAGSARAKSIRRSKVKYPTSI
jgi:hypothetical protein